MTARFGLTPRAEQDLEQIWDYTAQHWSVDQAEAYIRQLVETVDALSLNPNLGPACDHIRPGYRKHGVGSHVIFYKPRSGGIDVIRILHQRMDISDRL